MGFVSCRVAVPRDHPVHRKTVLAVGEMGLSWGFGVGAGWTPGMWVFGVEG